MVFLQQGEVLGEEKAELVLERRPSLFYHCYSGVHHWCLLLWMLVQPVFLSAAFAEIVGPSEPSKPERLAFFKN